MLQELFPGQVCQYEMPRSQNIKKVDERVPTRSICGPIFWHLAIERLLLVLGGVRQVKATIAYADDLLLLVEADSRVEIVQKAAVAIQQLTAWCSQEKLQLSTEKVTYAVLIGDMQRDPIIRLAGKSLRRNAVTKYLGIFIVEKANYTKHIQNIMQKGTAVMQKVARIAQGQCKIPLHAV